MFSLEKCNKCESNKLFIEIEEDYIVENVESGKSGLQNKKCKLQNLKE